MALHQYYSDRIETFKSAFLSAQKAENWLVFLRLLSFVTTIFLFIFLFSFNVLVASIALLTGLVVFAYIIKKNKTVSDLKQFYHSMSEINQKELLCLDGDFSSFPDGSEYSDKEHSYTSDLDIFGKASLFQFLNRTVSQPGSKTLSEWLTKPADIEEIKKRQKAVAELSPKTDWRQRLIAIEYKYSESTNNPESIIRWVQSESKFLHTRYLKILISILSLATLILSGAYLAGFHTFMLTIVFLINISILYLTTPKINAIHRSVSKTVDLLKSYIEIIKLIEEENFTSEKLIELKYALVNKNGNAQQQIQALSNLVNRLDFRLNLLVSGPLNLFFFWDIWQSIKLEKWKKQNIHQISSWFDAMAQFEAIASLSNICFNNPDWILPEILTDHFQLKTQGLGHPLIPENRRICNDLEINKSGKIVLVTGSNMSGKSTFLRTCGINIVLAMTGAPVCAKKMEVSRVMVFTSMRIIDSLEENTSSFYAELKRLATIIKTVEQKEKVFLLLDEILRGTNSNDRHIGSVALIKQLIKNDAIGIIATHDLALSQLGYELPDQIDNYNFDVKIENDELYFDYKLNQGICKSLNASILMKKMGIKI